MKNLSLQKKFMLLFFGIFFIPFAVLTFFSLSLSRKMMEQNTILHLQNLVEVKETAIEQWLQERIMDGKMLALSQEVRGWDPKRMEPYLDFKKKLHPGYRELLVVDRKGTEVRNRPSGRVWEGEEWFQEAMEKGIYVSSPQRISPSEPPLVIIALLIHDENEQPIGVLKELVAMDYVAQLIVEAHLGKTGKLFLANRKGEILLQGKRSEIPPQEIQRVRYFEKFSFQPTHTAVYQGYEGNEVLGSWKWIPGLHCFLIAEQEATEAFQQIRRLTGQALLILLISIGAIFVIAYWAIRSVTHPIELLNEAVASFGEGQFHKALVIDRKDEIGKLMEGFTRMAGQLKKAYGELEGKVKASNKELEQAYYLLKQRQEQLIRSEKMAALGQLSAGLAHEIRNPLTSIKLFVQSLEKEVDLDEAQREDFRIIQKEIDRLNGMVVRFLTFARPEEPHWQPVQLPRRVMDALNLLGTRMKNQKIRVVISLPPDLPPVNGDPQQLDQVVLNLLLNAVEAMPGGGTLEVRLAKSVMAETQEGYLQLRIRDTGPGIAAKDRPRLFDPFFTTKEGGTGLGLSIAYSVAQKHGGQIEVDSEEGRGATFILSLPFLKEEPWKKSSSSTMT